MAIIKKGQLDRIAGIVKRYTDWFIGRLFGPSYVDKPPVNIDEDNLTDLPGSMVTLSFELGLQEATLKDEEWSQLTWDAVKDSQRPLTEVQKLQVQAAEMSAYTQYRRLADDIANGLYDRLAQATRTTVSEAQVRGEIKEQIQAGVAGNRSYRDVAHSLVGELKEQQRNWTRVAATEMHAARQKGVAEAIRSGIDIYQGSDGIDSRITISLAPDACSDCRRIYSDPVGGKPRIFKLSELMANEGTNYIRPWRANARPVIPPLHPHCFCRMRYVPPGWGWNDEGRFTMINPNEAFSKGDLIPQGEPMSKAVDQESHSLLQASKDSLPSEDYIRKLDGEEGIEELTQLVPRLKKLQQMYIHDDNMYPQVNNLLEEAKAQHHYLSTIYVHGQEQGAGDE